MEGRSLESIEGIRLLAKVRSHIRDYQDTSVSSPVTDTAVSISSADESSTQTVPTTLVVCGVFGIATTIAFFAAQRAYFETVYEANHPQVIYSKEKRRQSRPIIRCVNFSLSSFDLLHKTAEAFGIAANFTSDQLTHYSTAGKSYFRTAESSKQNPSSIPGGKMDAHNSERKESISKWGREDWRGSSSGGGRLANDCRLRVLEAHHRFALDGYLKLKRKTEITSNDEMEHFQGMYEDLKLPTSPCLTEAVRVLIDGADPDVFLSLDTISRKCKGSSISIHHTVALSTDGTATRVFSSVLEGKVTDKWLKEIRSRQTPEQQTKPLPLEVLFEPSTNSFFPSAFGISGNRKENVWIQLNNILRYVYFNCPYDGLENDEKSILGENNVLTGPVNFWKSLKDYIFPNLQRRDRIISELFRKSVSKHNSTGDTIDILDGIMGWNCLSNETIAPRKNFPFLSLRYITYLKLLLHLQYGHQLDPPVHSLFEWGKYLTTKSTSKELDRAWIFRHLSPACSQQRLGSAPYSGSFEVVINFQASIGFEERVKQFFNESGRDFKVKVESLVVICTYLQEGTVQGVVLSSVEMFQILFVVGLNPTTLQVKLPLPSMDEFSSVNFISEKGAFFDKGNVSKLVNIMDKDNARLPSYDPSHPLCHKRGICPISDDDSRDPLWKSERQYFEAMVTVELASCNEDKLNVTEVVENMWSVIHPEKGTSISTKEQQMLINIKITDFEEGFSSFSKKVDSLIKELKNKFDGSTNLVQTAFIIFEQRP